MCLAPLHARQQNDLVAVPRPRDFQSELQDRWDSLSHREKQVVALACLGSRNYEIAQTLGIAPETVKTHLQHVYDKLHLRSRKELRLALKDWDFQDWWEHNRHE